MDLPHFFPKSNEFVKFLTKETPGAVDLIFSGEFVKILTKETPGAVNCKKINFFQKTS
jgi:hypothetical protein